MTAKEYFEYDQDKIPFKDSSTKDCETYNYDSEEPAYSKCEMIAFADSYHKKQLDLYVVGISAWYCKVENINGQWFEIVTGVNETDVAIKIDKAFGKGTRFEIQNEFKLM